MWRQGGQARSRKDAWLHVHQEEGGCPYLCQSSFLHPASTSVPSYSWKSCDLPHPTQNIRGYVSCSDIICHSDRWSGRWLFSFAKRSCVC
jgi:hypothetical protein